MILDSCFVIDLMTGDEAAKAKLNELTENAAPLAVSSLTVTEVGSGLREHEINQFDQVMDRMSVVPFGHKEARQAARMQRGL